MQEAPFWENGAVRRFAHHRGRSPLKVRSIRSTRSGALHALWRDERHRPDRWSAESIRSILAHANVDRHRWRVTCELSSLHLPHAAGDAVASHLPRGALWSWDHVSAGGANGAIHEAHDE